MGLLANSLAATPITQEEDKSLGGFVGNVFGDIGELITGLTSLVGSVGADAAKAVADPFVGGDFDYVTDDIVTKLPGALVEDYKNRYGGWDKFIEGLYEDPLAFVGDAATVATLGGASAAKGAQIAGKAGLIDDTSRIAKMIAPGGLTSKTPGGTVDVVNVANRIETLERSPNPIKRLAQEKIIEPLTTNPVSDATAEIAKLNTGTPAKTLLGKEIAPATAGIKGAAEKMPHEATIYDVLTGMKEKAAVERLETMQAVAGGNVARAYKPWYGNLKAKGESNRIFGKHGAHQIMTRQETIKDTREIIENVARGGSQTEAENFYKFAMFDPPEAAAHIPARTITDTISRHTDDRITIGSYTEAEAAIARAAESLQGQVINQVLPTVDQPMGALADIATPDGRTVTVRFQTPKTAHRSNALSKIDDDIDKMQGQLDGLTAQIDQVTDEAARERMVAQAAELERTILNATRYKESLGEGIAAEMVSDLTGAGQGALADGVDEMRWMLHDKVTGAALERGMLSYNTVVERAYLPQRIVEGGIGIARREDFDTDEAFLEARTARESVIDDIGMTDDLEARRLETGKKAPIYFPHMDPRRFKFSDFLMKRGTHGMLANQPGALKRAAGSFIDIKDGKPVFAGETDPVEAYGRMASQIQAYMEQHDLVQEALLRFGRKIEPGDEIAESEQIFNPHAVSQVYKMRSEMEQEIFHHLERGGEMEDAFAETLESVIPKNAKQVADLMNSKEVYAIPSVVANQLNKFVRKGTSWQVRVFWDAPTNLWRSMTLLGSPRWVLYNLLGNVTFLKMQGGRLSDVVRQAVDPKFKKTLEELFPEGMPEGVEGGFFSVHAQHLPHLGAAEKTRAGQAINAAKQSKIGRAGTRYGEWLRHKNEVIEDAFRRASYLKAVDRQLAKRNVNRTSGLFLRSEKSLRRIANEGLDEGSVRKAVDEVNYFFNDYTKSSPFERNVVRRAIAPFWSFYKHTAKLILSYPFKYPARANALTHLAEFAREMGSDLGPVPDWLEGAVSLEELWPAPGSEERLYTAAGANPFANLADFPRSAVGSLHPALKILLEQATGRNSFTGEKFTAPNVITPFGSDEQFRIDPETHAVEPVDRVAPGILDAVMGSTPPLKLLQDLMSGGARYGTGETMVDPSGRPLYPFDTTQKLAGYLGGPTQTFDIGEYQTQLAEDEAAAQLQYLRQLGFAAPAS